MKSFSTILCCLVIFGCKVQSTYVITPENLNPLLGTWKLHIMEVQDKTQGTWSEWRQGMTGFLVYEKSGYMSLHLAPRDYPNTNLPFKNFDDTMPIEQLKYISQNYNYTGDYTINLDSMIVSHNKLAHSNPTEWVGVSRRRFSFQNDTLVVVPVEKANSGLRLKFLKMPQQKVIEHLQN